MPSMSQSPTHNPTRSTKEPLIPWFIFTRERGFVVVAETVSQAISLWKKKKHQGEICGVIRGAAAETEPESLKTMRISETAVFGVICCGGNLR